MVRFNLLKRLVWEKKAGEITKNRKGQLFCGNSIIHVHTKKNVTIQPFSFTSFNIHLLFSPNKNGKEDNWTSALPAHLLIKKNKVKKSLISEHLLWKLPSRKRTFKDGCEVHFLYINHIHPVKPDGILFIFLYFFYQSNFTCSVNYEGKSANWTCLTPLWPPLKFVLEYLL
jgi:hypothetical protein